jgi:hypothetical protein
MLFPLILKTEGLVVFGEYNNQLTHAPIGRVFKVFTETFVLDDEVILA